MTLGGGVEGRGWDEGVGGGGGREGDEKGERAVFGATAPLCLDLTMLLSCFWPVRLLCFSCLHGAFFFFLSGSRHP